MEKYLKVGFLGEGSYGVVTKCKHVETGQTVAIKKFIDSDRDKAVKKIAMREIRMLKQLHHDNLVNLIEFFYHKKKLFLVFEYVDRTIADELERFPDGIIEPETRQILWQVLKAVQFCHNHSVIHRDIKPENILLSKSGVVKLCDFGFARSLSPPGAIYTDYVATRWYRAPELLVGDTKYGRAVDIWAIGCLVGELLTGDPVFPGDSDLDQLFHIVKCLGNITSRHQKIFYENQLFRGTKLPTVSKWETIEKRYKHDMSEEAIRCMERCLELDPDNRPDCSQLLSCELFTKQGFSETFPKRLETMIQEWNKCQEVPVPATNSESKKREATISVEPSSPATEKSTNNIKKDGGIKEGGVYEIKDDDVGGVKPSDCDNKNVKNDKTTQSQSTHTNQTDDISHKTVFASIVINLRSSTEASTSNGVTANEVVHHTTPAPLQARDNDLSIRQSTSNISFDHRQLHSPDGARTVRLDSMSDNSGLLERLTALHKAMTLPIKNGELTVPKVLSNAVHHKKPHVQHQHQKTMVHEDAPGPARTHVQINRASIRDSLSLPQVTGFRVSYMKTNAGTKENPLPAVPYWRVPIAFADRQTGLLESKNSTLMGKDSNLPHIQRS